MPLQRALFRSMARQGSRDDRWRALLELLLAVLVGSAIGLAVIVSMRFVENWKLIVGLVGGPAYVLVTLRRPEYGVLTLVALTIGLVDINWLPLLRFGAGSIHIQEIMLGVLLALLVFRSAAWQDFRLRNTPLSIPLLLFLFAVLLAMIHGVMFLGLGLNNAIQRGRSLLLWAAFLPTVQLIRDRKAITRFTIGLWAITGLLGVGVAVRLVYPSLHPFIFPVELEQLRTMGTTFGGVGRVFQYRGGALLYAMLPVIVAVLALCKDRHLRFWHYLVLMLLLGLVGNWLFRSFQRSMWVSMTLILFLLFVFLSTTERLRLIRRLLPIIVAFPLLIFVYWHMFPYETEVLANAVLDRIGSLLARDLARADDSVDWRVIETQYALDTFTEHPLLGIGPGNEYRPPLEREILWNEYGLRWFIHNAYLWIAVLTGLAGLLPFLALSGLFLFRIWYFWRGIEDDFLRAMYLGLGLSFLGQMISNNTQPTFFDGPAQSIYPVMMGLCESILFLTRQERMTA